MPFTVMDCALITRMAGVDTAVNLRELRERLLVIPVECLFHHFCETVIRPTFDDPEFRNDFAVWAARDLQDRALAERLGIINPYEFDNFEQLRAHVVEVVDDRLAELPHVPWVHQGSDYRFMQAVTVVFDTGRQLHSPGDFEAALPELSPGSLYYHYVEARRRTPARTDDFTAWLMDFRSDTESLRQALADVDFYFLRLPELRRTLIETVTVAGRGGAR
jgi:hypothetical protein